MGKLTKEEIARAQGMDYALRIAKKDGIEALEEEIKKRGITGISANVSHKEMEKATENMRNMMFDTMLCFTIGILHDKYGFGAKRAQEFKETFLEGTKLLTGDVIQWEGIIERIESELNMKVSIRQNDHDTRMERIY